MMTTELTGIPLNALPLDAFKAHLRVADGFDAIPGQADRLENALRSAIAALEARLGKILIQRNFILRTPSWTGADHLRLSMAPVVAVNSVKITRSGGEETILNPDTYALKPDAHRPSLVSRTGAFPILGLDAIAEVAITVGYASDWSDVPPALAQATLMLAETFFEGNRDNAALLHELPCAVCMLVEPFRDIRLRSLGGIQ